MEMATLKTNTMRSIVYGLLLGTLAVPFNLFATDEVTVNQSILQSDPTTSSPVLFTVVFDEAVTGFDDTDVDLSASTVGGTLSITVFEITPNDGTTYRVSVSGMSGDGDVVVTIPAGAATLVSDGVTTTAASTSTDNVVTFNENPDFISLSPNDNATGVSVAISSVTITFNENVVNVGDNSNNNNRIRIRNLNTTNDDEVIDPQAPGKVVIAGNVVTINLGISLAAGVPYAIRIGDSVFEDALGNPFAGTNDNTTWNFTIESGPDVVSYTPGSTCVGETLTINGSGFGTATPTVTVNGVGATVNTHTNSSIEIVVPNTGTGTVSVTNNDNGLSDTGPSLTVNPAILTNLNVVEVDANITTGTTADIQLQNSQNGVNYTLRRISPGPATTVDGPDPGNGGTLTFTTNTLSSAGTYQFRIRGTQGSCVADLTDIAVINVVDYSADAGSDVTICSGDPVQLGGDPTIVGGSGYYQITWSSNPAGFSNSGTNPIATPTTTTTYTITVEDSDGNITTDNVTVTVNPRANPNDFNIIFTPNQVAFSTADNPVSLSFTQGLNSGTGVLSGPGVNSSNNKFYPNAAPEGDVDITLTFTNNFGCPTTYIETVNVYDPNSVMLGLEPTYCPYGSDNLTVQIPAGYTFNTVTLYRYSPAFGVVPVGAQWTNAGTAVTINPGNLGPGTYLFWVEYTYTYIVGYNYIPYFDFSCFCILYNIIPIYNTITDYRYSFFAINTAPTAKIISRAGNEICRNDAPFDLTGSPAGGIWLGPAITPAPGNDGGPQFSAGDNGLATYNPALAPVGTNNIRYVYADEFTCRDTATFVLTVKDVPTLDFQEEDGCVGLPVTFDPTITIPPTVNVSLYLWEFGDDRGRKDIAFVDPVQHSYNSSNDYDVTFTAFTDAGCLSSVTKSISVGDIPDLAFKWASVCDGDPTRFSINSDFLETTPNDVQTISWDFGDGSPPFVDNFVLVGDSVRIHTYGTTGYFTAYATITSDLGCSTTESLPVYKVPRTGTITGANPYTEDFEDATFDAQGWVTGGQNSSWQWGTPSAPLISSASGGSGNAWVTNLSGSFNTNEKSWIHSPCFDLSELDRPVLSFDLRSLMRNQVDGAVLQVNRTGTTNDDSDWRTVGKVGQGVEWYNATGIFSNPGNQQLDQTGWTGFRDSLAWRTAIIALDSTLLNFTPLEKSRVRFRIAFSSPSDASSVLISEGFAVDNIQIAQRDRIILMESFVNSGGTLNDNNATTTTAINTFAAANQDELIKLEYHIGISGPNDDPLYLDNTADASARSAFYGVTSSPYVFLDGKAVSGGFGAQYGDQQLRSAGANIDTIFTTNSPAELLNIEVQFTPKQDLPAGTTLHIAVIEKTIADPAAAGTNGLTQFYYVMKKMLPTALGTRYTTVVPGGVTHAVNVSWAPRAYDLNEIAVIAFLQNEDTGEIYQARLLENPQYIPPAAVITGVEPDITQRIRIYPNPANEKLNVVLPEPAMTQVSFVLMDAVGKDCGRRTLAAGGRNAELGTGTLPPGVYHLLIQFPDGMVGHKKVIIAH